MYSGSTERRFNFNYLVLFISNFSINLATIRELISELQKRTLDSIEPAASTPGSQSLLLEK